MNSSSILFFLLCFLFASVNVQSARILIMYHIPGKSHHIQGEAYARGLSERGHQVTMFSPFPLKNQYDNCKHVLIDGVIETMERFQDMMQANQTQRFLAELTQFTDVVETMTAAPFQSKAFQDLIQSNEKFDLIILDYFFNTAHFGLAHHFNASLIVSSSSTSILVNHLTGNTAPYSFVPNIASRSADQMNFWERFSNTFTGIMGMMMHYYILMPTQEMLYRKYFKNGPQLEELENNVDLVFVNTHPVLETPRPYMPNMKQIGGFHLEEPKPLSKELREFIESAKDGVIFCSLGSMVKVSDLPKEKVDAFINTFSKLKQKIIWKWETDQLTNKPDNVLIGKWFPQRDILVYQDMMQAKQPQKFIAEFTQFSDIVEILTTASFESKGFQELKRSNEKFDLMIVDAFFNTAHFGIAHHFNASLIVSSGSLSLLVNHLTGNPAPFSFVPSLATRFTDQMNLWERFSNTFRGIVGLLIQYYILMPTQEKLYKKYFKNGPPLEELINNVDLVLMNTHPLLETPRPYMPNMILIGGFYLEEPKPLSKELLEFIESAKDGVIFFSLGSNVKVSDFPQEKVDAFINTFSKLKQKIIWKWESEQLINKPDNVFMGKWFPQRDILAHPNVKIFITHGGLCSTTEALFSGVPLVVIPFFGDQVSNAANVAAAGYGIQVLPQEISEETITNAIQEILTNKKYREEIQRRSLIINDQPMKPLASAIYWIEHILRHGNGKHLQSPASRINIFQYLLLDVAVVAAIIIATLIALISGLCYSIKFCCRRSKANKKRETKKSR